MELKNYLKLASIELNAEFTIEPHGGAFKLLEDGQKVSTGMLTDLYAYLKKRIEENRNG